MRTAAAALLSFLIASTALAAAPGQAGEPLAWTAVTAPAPSVAGARPGRVWRDVVPVVAPSAAPRAIPSKSVAISKPRPREVVGTVIRGIASWYCLSGVSRCTRGHPSGLYAAIRRDLLQHRGDRARVCVSVSRCVVAVVIDCNCGRNANLIDLYADAFRVLAPLSRGRLAVTLTWV